VETVATEESLVLIADMSEFDTFLSTLTPDVKSECEKITKSVIGGALETLPFLSGIKKSQLTMLAGMCRYEAMVAGQNVFNEGDQGDKLYILLSGECSVHVRHTQSDNDSGRDSLSKSKQTFMRTTNGELFGRDKTRTTFADVKRFSLDMTNEEGGTPTNLGQNSTTSVHFTAKLSGKLKEDDAVVDGQIQVSPSERSLARSEATSCSNTRRGPLDPSNTPN